MVVFGDGDCAGGSEACEGGNAIADAGRRECAGRDTYRSDRLLQTAHLAMTPPNAYVTLRQDGAARFSRRTQALGGFIVCGARSLIVLPLLAALGGCRDTRYEGSILLTDPDSLSARLVPGVMREGDVRPLLGGSLIWHQTYGVMSPNGQFVGWEHDDQYAWEECPFVERQYITVRKLIGSFLIPDQTDTWSAWLGFDGTGVLLRGGVKS